MSHRLRSAAVRDPQKHERSAGFCFPSPTSHSGPWATHASHGMNSLVALLDNLHDLAVFALEAGAVWIEFEFEESVPLHPDLTCIGLRRTHSHAATRV